MSPRPLGSVAPPLDLPTASGAPWSLAGVRGRNVILSFLGPANCMFCRAHVIRLIQAQDRIFETGTEVVLVAHHDPELMMAKMMHSLDLPFVLLIDPTKSTYRRWGLGTVGFKAFTRPGLYLEAARMLLRREKSLGSAPDQTQMGGDFVVDRQGTVVFANRLRSFHDRASVDDLLSVVRGL
jgi:peroxiredoxin